MFTSEYGVDSLSGGLVMGSPWQNVLAFAITTASKVTDTQAAYWMCYQTKHEEKEETCSRRWRKGAAEKENCLLKLQKCGKKKTI